MAAQAALPHRTTSTGSDDAVPGDDTSAAASLLLERLQAWKHLCGNLESYVSATEKVQRAHSKEYEKVLKTISDPLREGHHFDQNLGGMAGLFENMRSNTQAIANLHLETEKNLKGSTLPILERLHAEVKNKNKELTSGAAKGSKAVDKARNTTQAHIELLGQHTASFDSSGHKAEPHMDPYVLQRGIYHRLNKQILEENSNRADLLSVQDNFQKFEAHVIQTIQQAMGSFAQYMGGQSDRTKALYTDILGTTQCIPLDFEWKGFVSRNDTVLVDRSQAPRSIDNTAFPNQNHRATQPLIEGTLERKSRMIGKGYSTGYYVVTPSKFLHEYKDTDNFRNDPKPELSLYLPDCTLGGINGPKFSVKGKDASGGKVGSRLASSHELEFKAHTPADADKWHSVIRSAAAGSSVAAAAAAATTTTSTDASPISPVSQRGASGASGSSLTQPPAYADHKTSSPTTGASPTTTTTTAGAGPVVQTQNLDAVKTQQQSGVVTASPIVDTPASARTGGGGLSAGGSAGGTPSSPTANLLPGKTGSPTGSSAGVNAAGKS
ncbi:MAG: hypothetical protein M1825_000540 [Sarcosagium campestre]|nr:MAG: hypothetical protein M1825_000540 [Sarcosagium campestre]